MMPVSRMKELLRERGHMVEACLAVAFDGRPIPQRLKDSMQYSLQAGGKRLRPVSSACRRCLLCPGRIMCITGDYLHTLLRERQTDLSADPAAAACDQCSSDVLFIICVLYHPVPLPLRPVPH